ncbi:hypothetical protein PFISCL1PPCAC_25415, partial [Pristionchus fissidentatus]
KLITPIYREIMGMPEVKEDPAQTSGENCGQPMNVSSIVLHEFSKRGYITMMAEDWMNGVFNWPGCKGFPTQPTTHYLRPFQTAYENSALITDIQGKRNCFETHHFLNDYFDQFVAAYPGAPKVALLWATELGHGNAEIPFHADGEYRALFGRHQKEFDNSFLFFMGDHGPRLSAISRTVTGLRDQSNPLMMISIPRRLRKTTSILANLRANGKKLLTHFDLYATFRDIAESFAGAKEKTNFDKTEDKMGLMGTSLFRPLPAGSRTCKTLPIPLQYCLCKIDKARMEIEPKHFQIVELITNTINAQLSDNGFAKMCETLSPDQMISIERVMGSTALFDVTIR